jgi:hypothetical protein
MKKNSNPKANKPDETRTPESLRKQIETRAYQIWIANGQGHGSDLQHWLQAEAETLEESQKTPPKTQQ